MEVCEFVVSTVRGHEAHKIALHLFPGALISFEDHERDHAKYGAAVVRDSCRIHLFDVL